MYKLQLNNIKTLSDSHKSIGLTLYSINKTKRKRQQTTSRKTYVIVSQIMHSLGTFIYNV